MACGLSIAKLLFKKYGHIVSWTYENNFQWNLNQHTNIFIQAIQFENGAPFV